VARTVVASVASVASVAPAASAAVSIASIQPCDCHASNVARAFEKCDLASRASSGPASSAPARRRNALARAGSVAGNASRPAGVSLNEIPGAKSRSQRAGSRST